MNVSDIAKLAGVSNSAVSRYFNHGYISQEKREAIRKVVEETGYRPSVQAQTLRTKKTNMIGVIVPKIASASIGKIVEGILSVLNKSNYQMLLAVTENDPKKELEYLLSFNSKQVDGLILAATVFSEEHKRLLKHLTVPAVITGQKLHGQFCVYHDDYHAAYDITEYVLEKGKRNLAYMNAILSDEAAGAKRYRGYCDAVRDRGFEALASQHITADFTVVSGYEKTRELLSQYPGLDAILCATDSMAAGAMQFLAEHGITVPDQILVTGQDDSDIARVTSPPIITVHYSFETCGKTAVRMLLEQINQKDAAPKEVKLGYSITDYQTKENPYDK